MTGGVRGSGSGIVVLLILLLTARAQADIAPDPLSGGTSASPYGGHTNQVSMVEETVRIRVSREWCNVDLQFVMLNISKKPATVKVGFPAEYRNELQNFRAAVSGKVVKTSDKTSSRNIGRGEYSRSRTTYWKTWESVFPVGKKVFCRVAYRTKLKGTYSWVLPQTSGDVGHTLARKVSPEARQTLHNKLACRDVRYILTSGRGWAGPIGKCRVEVTFVDGLTTGNLVLGYPRSLPKGSELTKESLSWTLRDFEPKHDIYFQVTPFINQTETKALLEKAHKRTPHDPQLADYLAKYLEADGQTDQQQKLYEDLLKAWHGRVALWGPGSEDQQRLTGSRQIFSLIRRLTGAYGKSPAPKPEKLASSIEQIMLKIQQQMKLARPDDRFAKLFRPQIDEVLDWCRRQRT